MALTAEKTLLIASAGRPTNAALAAAAPLLDPRLPAVELRLDALEEQPDFPALRRAFAGRTLLATLRSRAEGGRFAGTAAEAASLLGAALDAGFDLVDVELALGGAGLLGLPREKVVVSSHDFDRTPDDLEERAARLGATNARFAKLVVTAAGLDDALRLLRLQAVNAGERRLAAFGMGEAGLVTRALSPYLGAALSYGAALADEATAPGQLPAADLLDVYAVGRSRRVEALFALLGGRVSHSLSPAIHNSRFEELGLPSLYAPVALASLAVEIGPLREAFDELGLPLRGASVTVPLKEEAAALAGAPGEARNTLLFGRDGSVAAANTDFEALLAAIPAAPEEGAALVLGAGGMARSAVEALVARGWRVDVAARTASRAAALASSRGARTVASPTAAGVAYAVVVNATPLGLDASDPLPCPGTLLGPGVLAVDAPYRPGGTAFARLALRRGARVVDGFTLLLAQAAGQSALFTNREANAASLAALLPSRLSTLFEVSR
ncbi:MAG: type I 3-dehydroquinate dehydratase [Thermoanaerobaculia bacterium]